MVFVARTGFSLPCKLCATTTQRWISWNSSLRIAVDGIVTGVTAGQVTYRRRESFAQREKRFSIISCVVYASNCLRAYCKNTAVSYRVARPSRRYFTRSKWSRSTFRICGNGEEKDDLTKGPNDSTSGILWKLQRRCQRLWRNNFSPSLESPIHVVLEFVARTVVSSSSKFKLPRIRISYGDFKYVERVRSKILSSYDFQRYDGHKLFNGNGPSCMVDVRFWRERRIDFFVNKSARGLRFDQLVDILRNTRFNLVNWFIGWRSPSFTSIHPHKRPALPS